jgi:peptidoglycan LD-endopeptidase LytH
MRKKVFHIAFNFLKIAALIIMIQFIIPNKLITPIKSNDFIKIDSASFWYYPWGESGIHKGVDIFCKKNADVIAPIYGFITKKGYGSISGNYLYLLGPKLRLYYFAHLDTIVVNKFTWVAKGTVLGKAGNTGNAILSPTHLHFSIETILPYFWLRDKNAMEGHKKMYYLNPLKHLHRKLC